jgi:hypothetical protein
VEMMEITVSTDGAPGDLRALQEELRTRDDWRGRLEPQERPPGAEDLGPVLEALRVFAEPGTVTALVTVIITVVRHRSSDVNVTMTRSRDKKTVTVSAKRVRKFRIDELEREIKEISRKLDELDPDSDQPEGS